MLIIYVNGRDDDDVSAFVTRQSHRISRVARAPTEQKKDPCVRTYDPP